MSEKRQASYLSRGRADSATECHSDAPEMFYEHVWWTCGARNVARLRKASQKDAARILNGGLKIHVNVFIMDSVKKRLQSWLAVFVAFFSTFSQKTAKKAAAAPGTLTSQRDIGRDPFPSDNMVQRAAYLAENPRLPWAGAAYSLKSTFAPSGRQIGKH